MPTNAFAPANRPSVKTLIAASHENIVEHAGSGFQLPESTARLLDERAKELPKDFTYRRLAASPSEFDLPEGERTDVSFITTDAVDRDGEVVLPQGIDWKSFNGCVQPFHDYKQMPVGVSWWIRPRMAGVNNGLVAKTYYPTKPEDWGDAPWLPSAILHLMQMPIPVCTGKSIGFLPLEIRNATAEEKGRRPDWKDKPIISRSLGLEYSVVSIPANPTAEMEAVSKAFEAGGIPQVVADLLAKCLNVTPEQAAAEIEIDPAEVAAKAAEEARKAALAEALAAPYYTADAYAMQQRAAMDVARSLAETKARQAIDLAIAAIAGRV